MSNDLERPDQGVVLIVDSRKYSGWKSIRVTRSIETLAGSFALDVSDRWAAQDKPWPIVEESECRVEIDGISVIDGWVDKRSISASSDSRTLSYSGRDRAGALVDCSAFFAEWTFKKVDVAQFAAKVAAPFGIRISVQPGLELAGIPKISFSPGDSAFEVIRRVAGDDGVLLVSDGAGGIVITRSGSTRATSLVEGEGGNISTASVDYDAANRYSVYLVTAQAETPDDGELPVCASVARDEGVRRAHRGLMIQPDKGYDYAGARRLADWEARMRAARAETVTIGVQGWKQPNGQLWPVNALTHVKAPRLIGVDGDMLITQVEYSTSEQGTTTQLRLMRPDTFTPTPQATTKPWKGKKKIGAWPELSIPTAASEAINQLNATIKKLTGG